ncbi:hypothetical protein OV203_04010 [Nannocystis sp. ILAH1]|uniref:hypothetical protein n=1 Tax=unclassified Nannocystis TaxID=2627009 RepID=UPI00227128E0|nr:MULTISPECIES: hypothetical protein [unclassified Nannocystis]MCY0986278.1 hypothetical protein [Nannocystis sp. ILAH1]MCY1068873.1 hypothetical protein [Nannocystis sp. RBIL2]
MYASILVALSLVLSPAPGVCRSAPSQPAQAERVLLPPASRGMPKPPPAKRERLAASALVAIDTAAAGEEGQLMTPRIQARVVDAMKAFNITEGKDAGLPKVAIKVSELGGDAIGWSYTIDVRHGSDQAISGGSLRGECVDCIEKELVEKVGTDARLALQQLRVYIDEYNAKVDADNKQAEAAATPTTSDTAATPGGPAAVGGPGTDASPMHPLCKAGIGLMAAGVVGIGVGVGLAVLPDRQLDPNIGYEFRSTTLPGYVTLGIGGAAALAGVALFVVGHRKSRASQTALVPSFGAGVVGLQWSGRF